MSEKKRELTLLARRARSASLALSALSSKRKNEVLTHLSEALIAHADEILAENARDLELGKKQGLSAAMLDRLALTRERIEGMAKGISKLVALPDPIGVGDLWHHASGMQICRTRVPLGVIGIIYEARPNVTSDAAALCFKSANAVILRGGKEALFSNEAIVRVLRRGLKETGVPEDAISLIASADREYTSELLALSGEIDALIPRGGAGLIRFVKENARVPVIETGAGNCHLYVHEDADLALGLRVLINAKVSRPSVCNAVEHLLVHEAAAPRFLPEALGELARYGVTVRGCEKSREIAPSLAPLLENDDETEYNDLVLSVRVVEGLEEAVSHINRYGTRHSETIITESLSASAAFGAAVDAACVYTNASSRFTDGEEFGFGAEIGISTQKLHARGPMGLNELTTVKYLICGEGQTRGTPPEKA